MAQGTSRSCTLAGVAIVTMILVPARRMGLGSGRFMTGRTGILLMTDQAAPAIPGGLDTMRFQPPKVVMR